MSSCPCCSGTLLRHVRVTGVYWICLRCRQEMPAINGVEFSQYPKKKLNLLLQTPTVKA
ncbi:MAG: hypothetical protein F6K31_31605 [Symploca sp. SIO2G7]|nr:hypothetical protein [Symploca sp. SIO2G7]